MEFIVGLVVCVVLGMVAYFGWQAWRRHRMSRSLNELPDFHASQEVMGEKGDTGLAIDERRKRLCFITDGRKGVEHRVVSYADVISSEVIEDGSTVTRASRGSQLGGAVVGGALLGGVGAIIGGLSGTRISTGTVRQVSLRVTVSDTSSPTHEVGFLKMETNKPGAVYDAAMKTASHWQGVISAIIREVENATNSRQEPTTVSVATELKGLVELRDSGVLTDQEFQREKAKLLER